VGERLSLRTLCSVSVHLVAASTMTKMHRQLVLERFGTHPNVLPLA
jgi:hypothetical protein